MTPEGGAGELDSIKRQLRVVTEVANQLATRLYALEDRLARIEGVRVAQPTPQPHFVAAPDPLPAPPPPPFEPEPFVPPSAPPLPPPPVGPKIETQVGLTLVNRIGVITLILFVAFFFKYAVDSDWIGPSGRVILGVLAGAATLFGGDVLWRRGHRIFAQGFTALGLCILYLSFYAAFGFYQLIPQTGALLLMVVTAAFGGTLALRYNVSFIAILSLLGAHLTPYMLSTGTPNDVFFASYMAIINGAALWFARRRGWRVVEIVAMVSTILLEGFWIADRHRQIGDTLGVVSTVAQYGLFVSGPMWPIAVIAQLAAAVVIGSFHWQPIVQLLLVLVGIIHFYWRKWDPGPSDALVGWTLAYVVGVLDAPDPLAMHAFLYNAIAFLIFLAWPVWLAIFRREPPTTSTLTTMAVSGALFFGIGHHLLHIKYADYMGLMAVLVAALYLLAGWLIWNSQSAAKRDSRTPILAAGMALAFLALAVPIQFTGYTIAIVWAIQSAALALIAWRLPSPRVLIGSAFLALLALADLPLGVVYAPEQYRPLLNSGFVTMAVVTISLWLAAYFTIKTPGVPEFAAGLPYVVGHLVLLTGLHYEIFSYLDWTKHSWNAKLLASTLLLAVYGLLLLMLGIRTRTFINRIMGLVLFGTVIFKLYLSDVWLLDNIFKIIAFGALGGLLVAGSYLYSRFRTRIETVWKKDDAPIT